MKTRHMCVVKGKSSQVQEMMCVEETLRKRRPARGSLEKVTYIRPRDICTVSKNQATFFSLISHAISGHIEFTLKEKREDLCVCVLVVFGTCCVTMCFLSWRHARLKVTFQRNARRQNL